jgi:hypothetical protein
MGSFVQQLSHQLPVLDSVLSVQVVVTVIVLFVAMTASLECHTYLNEYSDELNSLIGQLTIIGATSA